MSLHDLSGICANRRKLNRMPALARKIWAHNLLFFCYCTVGCDKNSWWLREKIKVHCSKTENVRCPIMNEVKKQKQTWCERSISCKLACLKPRLSDLSSGLVIASCVWGNRRSPTTRIDHTEVLPGSWKAGVPKGLVGHSNNALLFAVAGLGHQVYSLVVQALLREKQRETQEAGHWKIYTNT